MRWRLRLLLILLLALGAVRSAGAATYSYRGDTFAWETAANAVVWDRTCTAYPGDDDKATVAFTGGFQFRFAGVNYGSVRILSNGMLQFGADSGFHRVYSNTPLPAGATGAYGGGCAAGATTHVMMAYWTDLNPAQPGSGNVTWEQKGVAPNRRFVVSWNGVYQYGTGTPYAVQIVLHENGEFTYQYGNGNATGAQATIGVQVNSTDFTLYSYNSGYNANGSAIRWSLVDNNPVRLAEYRFDESSYSGRVGEVRDSTGNGNHGVRVGTASSHAAGAICRGVDIPLNENNAISGVDTQVNVATSIGSRGGFSFWWRYALAWNGSKEAMLLDASGSEAAPIFIERGEGGVLRFRVTDSSGTIVTATTPPQNFSAGTWVHIAGSWRLAAGANQSTLRIYVNGNLVGATTRTTNGALAANAGRLFVGDARLGFAPSEGTVYSANGRIDELRLYNYDIGIGEVLTDRDQSHPCAPPLDHVQIEHPSGNGLTCTPSTLTLRACADSSCSAPFEGGVSGTLSGSGGVAPLWPDGATFTIPAGQSSTTARVQLPTPGSSLLNATVPAATQGSTCNFGAPSCTYSASDAGLLVDIPYHRSEAAVWVDVMAVRRSDNGMACVPAFANVARTVQLRCGYVNPASGTMPVRASGRALNAGNNLAAACDASGQALSLNFDASGFASTSLNYADAGLMQVTATYTGTAGTGDPGLVLSGSTQFIAAPNDFRIDNLPAGALTAGLPFAARATARNVSGATTPNFGNETPPATLSWQHIRRAPSSAAAVNGVLSGGTGAVNGVASANNLAWSEVGRIDLQVETSNYLGSFFGVQGSTGAAGALGPFRPHHLQVRAVESCGTYSYAGQPFSVTVTARNAADALTLNYFHDPAAPSFAREVTFSDGGSPALGLGNLAPATLAASTFSAGEASTQLSYPFTAKASGPGTVLLRATDSDGVSSSAFANADDPMALRSGRLVLQSAIGSAQRPLNLPLRLEQWKNQAWVLVTDDTCTAPSAAAWSAALAQSGRVNALGAATAAWTTLVQQVSLVNGTGSVRLAAPSPSGSGALDVALNLGSAAADRACLPAPRPATMGLGLSWLRSRQGSVNGCGAREDSDPSARATFGAPPGHSTSKVHERVID